MIEVYDVVLQVVFLGVVNVPKIRADFQQMGLPNCIRQIVMPLVGSIPWFCRAWWTTEIGSLASISGSIGRMHAEILRRSRIYLVGQGRTLFLSSCRNRVKTYCPFSELSILASSASN